MPAVGLKIWWRLKNKAVELMLRLHEVQQLTSMRLRNLRLRFLLNWNVVLTKKEIPEGVLRTNAW